MMIKDFRVFKSVISAQRKRQVDVDAALLDLSRKNSEIFIERNNYRNTHATSLFLFPILDYLFNAPNSRPSRNVLFM